MSQTNQLQNRQIHSASVGKRMLQGAGIAFLFIVLFISGVEDPDPQWPKYWMLRLLVVVPLAGAIGGIFYYFMDLLRYPGGWKNILAIILSMAGYLVAVWPGTVLGLDGTLWD